MIVLIFFFLLENVQFQNILNSPPESSFLIVTAQKKLNGDFTLVLPLLFHVTVFAHVSSLKIYFIVLNCVGVERGLYSCV